MKASVLFIFFFLASDHFVSAQYSTTSWQEIQLTKKGTVTIYWLDNNPFGYKDANGNFKGIEIEVVEDFRKFLKHQYSIDLTFNWQNVNSFTEIMEILKTKPEAGAFGVAGFSINEERKKFLKFSTPYLADITVLVSTDDIPLIRETADLSNYLRDATAITAPGTTLEKDILTLFKEAQLTPKILYRKNSYEFLQLIKTRRKSFGYLNLPVYLMDLNKGLSSLRRHNYLTKVNEGRAIALSSSSDWDIPLKAYFSSEQYKSNIEFIIGSYINLDLYRFIEKFSPENEVSLLNKEKEIQQAEIRLQELELTRKNQRQRFLIVTVFLISLFLIVLVFLLRRQSVTTRLLRLQKKEIESQSELIKSINASLEGIVKERTIELERRNKALEEYAFITAHKLRAPLASILGLVSLIQRIKLNEEDRILVSHLEVTSKNLDTIIYSIIDAIERKEDIK